MSNKHVGKVSCKNKFTHSSNEQKTLFFTQGSVRAPIYTAAITNGYQNPKIIAKKVIIIYTNIIYDVWC